MTGGHRTAGVTRKAGVIIDDLAARDPQSSYSTIVENALKVYKAFLDEVETGSSVVFRRADGTDQHVVVLIP